MNVNSRFCEVFVQTVDREMDLQETIGVEIFTRYGIVGDIEQVNENHRKNVQAFNKQCWEVKAYEIKNQAV